MLIIGTIFGLCISFIFPIIAPHFYLDTPVPLIDIYQLDTNYTDGENIANVTWKSEYSEYTVSIYTTSDSKTIIQDGTLVINFNAPILSIQKGTELNADESIKVGSFLVLNGNSFRGVSYNSLTVDFMLKPEGIISFNVITGSPLDELELDLQFPIDTRPTFTCKYYYEAYGILARKEINGWIPIYSSS